MNKKLQLQESDQTIDLILNNDPENTMDMEVIQQLLLKLSDITSDDQNKPIIIHSEGHNFSKGYDCSCLLVKDNEFLANVVSMGTAIAQLIHNYDRPVVAFAHGYAMGAGLELLISCDYVIADDSFKSGFPETMFNFPNIMIPPEAMGKLIPRASLNSLATGSSFNIEESLNLGIVNKRGTLKDAREIAILMNNNFFSRSKQYYMLDQKEIKNYVQYIGSIDTHTLKLRELENYRKTHFS